MASLPTSERDYLASLPLPAQKSRLAALHASGWSLTELAEALDPPRPKTTIHYWIQNAASQPASAPPTPNPPTLRIPNTKTRPISPQVPPGEDIILRELACEARKYRAGTPAHAPAARANRELTDRALRLRSFGVPTSAIAAAAGVSYRAMARRVTRD